MPQGFDALWLNVSPALQGFDRPLLKQLSQHTAIALWEYQLTADEPIALETALLLLNEFLEVQPQPVHLIGHATSGLLGLLYARLYPDHVRSLTLLSVGVYPGVDWQAHFYAQLKRLPCSRKTLLKQMVYNLFGYQSRPITDNLIRMLDRDLQTSLSPHTLYQQMSFIPGGVPVPLLVCGSQDDVIIDAHLLQGWQPWLKSAEPSVMGDQLWQCDEGRYFFHYFYPTDVSQQITRFWSTQSPCYSPLQILESVH
jgi:pimeloyl-ACP methyl ester carboxylesterase